MSFLWAFHARCLWGLAAPVETKQSCLLGITGGELGIAAAFHLATRLMIKAAASVLWVPIRIFFIIILSSGKIKTPGASASSAGFMQCEVAWSHRVGACPKGNLGKGLHGFLG